jgi:hypothetical protein
VKFRAIVDAQLKTLPMVDTAAMREALDQFHRNPPPLPKRVVERVAGRLHISVPARAQSFPEALAVGWIRRRGHLTHPLPRVTLTQFLQIAVP